MWIFGYGSLMWKVDFPYTRKLAGFIQGYNRRFWQSSEDHRGVPGKPGRVVTLVASEVEDGCVWGTAYEISDAEESRVLVHLDYREKDGYSKVETVFHPRDRSIAPFPLTVYVGSEKNPFYAGPATVEAIAEQIAGAVGPSGTNVEYLLNLAQAMRDTAPGIHDEHLFQIEAAVKRRIIYKNGF